jgi:hypothetical protein
MGDADRARKDSSNRAVTRPVERHVEPASFLFGNMPGVEPMRVDVEIGEGRILCRKKKVVMSFVTPSSRNARAVVWFGLVWLERWKMRVARWMALR